MSPGSDLSFLLPLLVVAGAVAVVLVRVLVLVTVLVLALARVVLFLQPPSSIPGAPRFQSARRPLCRRAFSRMAVTKVSFNWYQRWTEDPAHPARRNSVPRSNLCRGDLHFTLFLADKTAE